MRDEEIGVSEEDSDVSDEEIRMREEDPDESEEDFSESDEEKRRVPRSRGYVTTTHMVRRRGSRLRAHDPRGARRPAVVSKEERPPRTDVSVDRRESRGSLGPSARAFAWCSASSAWPLRPRTTMRSHSTARGHCPFRRPTRGPARSPTLR
jgi:hypothetical protein